MDDSLIYYLENVSCQYRKSLEPVLEIDKLSIRKGNIVFFVGASGVGKSTLLETLGLMNKTVVNRESSVFKYFNYSKEKSDINLIELWNKNESVISKFRREHLSFVFQNINMFNNLTALENVCLAQIVQGKDYEEAWQSAKLMLKRLFDDDAFREIVFGKKVFEFSGGQRQRLAFARAALTDSAVLLADEPTGNLDARNADKLMKELVNTVKQESKTAIVVTHDISMAIKYGDQVVLLQKKIIDDKKVMGKISSDGIYTKHNLQWKNQDNVVLSNEEITEYLWKGLE